MNNANETTLLDKALQALQAHGLTTALQNAPQALAHLQADAWLRVGKDEQHVDYAVEVRRMVTPATLGAVVTQLRHLADAAGQPPLLVAGCVTPPVADKLRELKQQFADAAGNAYLEGPGFLVQVAGRRLPDAPATGTADKAFAVAGLKVVFALICDPALAGEPQRAIARAAGVALGAIPPVMADLQRQGYLYVDGRKRRFLARKRLLDEWALIHARTLRPKTLRKTYVTPAFDTWRDWKLDRQLALWGGEPAANLLVDYLRPGILTIYAVGPPGRFLAEQRVTGADPHAQGRYLELRTPFWGDTLRNDGRPDTVPPALVYADLLATGDARCIETAQMIYEAHLARLFDAG